MTRALYRAMPEQNLKRNTWYYGVRCDCGLQIVVHEDFSQGYGDDFLELPKPIPVECNCGTVSHAQRFQKLGPGSTVKWPHARCPERIRRVREVSCLGSATPDTRR